MKTKVYLSTVNIKQRIYFNNLAKNYFKELDNKFKASELWKKKFLEMNLKKKDTGVFWIKSKSIICGFFIVDKTYSHLSYKKKIYLRDFYIKKEFRHKGIGLQSFSQIKKYFKKKNINKVEVEILNSNKKVINFWKKNKFTIKSLKYSLNI